jgi:transporter family protein
MNWLALAAIAIVAWGAVGLLQKISSNLLDPTALVFWVIVGLLVGSVPLIAWLPADTPLALSGGIIAAGLLSGLANALGSWCLFRALKNGAAASIVIPFTALYPLITVLLAFMFLGETLNLRQCLGAVLAIGGGALLSYEPPAQPQSAPFA